jgi:hypothetical protein
VYFSFLQDKKQEDTTENGEDKKLLQGDDAPTSPTKTDEVEVIEEGDEKPSPTDKSWSKDLLAKIPKVKMPSNPFRKGSKVRLKIHIHLLFLIFKNSH